MTTHSRRKLSQREYSRRLQKVRPTVEAVGKYVNAVTRITHRCLKHGLEWDAAPMTMMQPGISCRRCLTLKQRKTHAGGGRPAFEKQLAAAHPNIRLIGKYRAQKSKTTFFCLSHDVQWEALPNNVLRSKYACPICHADEVIRSNYKGKTYRLGDREVVVQGYEPLALDYILSLGYSASDIAVSSEKEVPVILWGSNRKTRRHYPDIFIKSRMLIVEVKSTYTFGMLGCENFYRTNRAKTIAAKAQGYRYMMLVLDDEGRRIQLPKRWWRLSHKQFMKLV